MTITKALITAAGDRQRRIPLQTLVDGDGETRTVLAMLVNEAAAAGVEEVCVVIPPGEREAYASAVPDAPRPLRFLEQRDAPGYAGAIWCAREHLAAEPFLHLVGDHVYINGSGHARWAAQLVAIARAENCAVSALQATHESVIGRFGVVGGVPESGQASLFRLESVVEKPTPTLAEQQLIVPGLRAAHYLAFFGMHVLTPTVLDLLAVDVQADPRRASVSGALQRLAAHERYLGWQVSGQRYDLGARYGLLQAQLALSLAGRDRDEVLSSLVGLLALHTKGTQAA